MGRQEAIKDDYRLFKIKTVEGIDDFAMIGEVAQGILRTIQRESAAISY